MGKPNPVIFKNNDIYLKYTTTTTTTTTNIEDIDYFVIPSGSIACPINTDISYITTTIPPSTTRRPTTTTITPTTSSPTTSPPTTSPPTTSPPVGNTSTVLLLHGDTINVGFDSSIYNNTVNVVGQVSSNSSVTKNGFGNSIFFNGNGHLSINQNNNNMALGGNFTVDFWIYWTGSINQSLTLGIPPSRPYAQLVGAHQAGVAGDFLILLLDNGQIFFQVNNSYGITDTPVITSNTWIHVGMVRSGTTVALYINGSLRKSFIDSTTVASNVKIGIGAEAVTSGGGRAAFIGYMDEIRFLKGVANANFPQGAPYSS